MGVIGARIKGSNARVAAVNVDGMITNYSQGEDDVIKEVAVQAYNIEPSPPNVNHVGVSIDLVPRVHWAVDHDSRLDIDVEVVTRKVPIAVFETLTITTYVRSNQETFYPTKQDILPTEQDPAEPQYFLTTHISNSFVVHKQGKMTAPTFNLIMYLKDVPELLLELTVIYSVRAFKPFRQHRDRFPSIVDSFEGVELPLLFAL